MMAGSTNYQKNHKTPHDYYFDGTTKSSDLDLPTFLFSYVKFKS
jgi:hypothetical protein